MLLVMFVTDGMLLFTEGLGALHGVVKGFGALMFGRATAYEIEFQTWRNRRFYKAEYGTEEPSAMLALHLDRKGSATRPELASWLVQVNGIDPDTAKGRVDNLAKTSPHLVLPERATRTKA